MSGKAPRVSVVSPDRIRPCDHPAGFAGSGEVTAYIAGERDPIHVLRHRLLPGEELAIGPLAADCLAYVWTGELAAGGALLAAGSSVIVEHGSCSVLEACDHAGQGGETIVLTFAAAQPAAHGRAGGHVHLLPAGNVPSAAALAGSSGVGGALHADGQCPTCEVWLHENRFAPPPALSDEQAREQAQAGIHSHSEDEVIFILDGAIRLGQKLFPAGTAVAIAGDTLYAIGAGPQGMRFINFRAGTPADIRFASGRTMSETEYWRQQLPRPEYLSPAAEFAG